MDARFWRQVVVFAAVFLLMLVGINWLRGTPVTPDSVMSAMLVVPVATGIYGAMTLWLNKCKKRGD